MRRLVSDEENHQHTVVFDVDGVLIDVAHRLSLCPGRPGVTETTWDAYHAAVWQDDPLLGNIALTQVLWRGGYDVVLVTNRPEEARQPTEVMLRQFGVQYSKMFMREDGGNHGSKEWVIERLHLPTTVLAVEDDRKHLEMYTSHGIPGLYVHSGYYEGIDDETYYGSHYVPGGSEKETQFVEHHGTHGFLRYALDPTQSVLVPTSGSTWRGVAVHDARAGETVEVRIP